MDNTISTVSSVRASYTEQAKKVTIIPKDLRVSGPKDILDLGSGTAVSNDQAMGVVLDRAMEKLRSVVTDARKALGLSENETIDTSPEATGNRIADFALSAFDKWAEKHTEVSGDDARKQFAEFIGGAVQQGIGEARSILGSLNALSDTVNQNIDSTWEVVSKRLDDFVQNGK